MLERKLGFRVVPAINRVEYLRETADGALEVSHVHVIHHERELKMWAELCELELKTEELEKSYTDLMSDYKRQKDDVLRLRGELNRLERERAGKAQVVTD